MFLRCFGFKSIFYAVSVSLLAGCSASKPAPVSSLTPDYNQIARGSYRGSFYEVQPKDTLYFIAYVTGSDVNEIAKNNGLTEPYIIHPGQKLKLWSAQYAPPAYGQPSENAAPNPQVAIATAVPPITRFEPESPAAPSKTNGKYISQKKPRPESQHENKIESQLATAYSQAVDKVKPPAAAKTDPLPISPVVVKTPVAAKAPPAVITPPVVKPPAVKEAGVKEQQPVSTPTTAKKPAAKPKPVPTKPAFDAEPSWQWPAPGRILSGFSSAGGGNKGIDIGGNKGQPIVAAAQGIVVYAGNALRGYGNLIIIKHNDDFLSAYAHNEQLLVKENDPVAKGQKIATMGSSGTTGVKLHFEIRFKGKSVNPSRYLPKR